MVWLNHQLHQILHVAPLSSFFSLFLPLPCTPWYYSTLLFHNPWFPQHAQPLMIDNPVPELSLWCKIVLSLYVYMANCKSCSGCWSVLWVPSPLPSFVSCEYPIISLVVQSNRSHLLRCEEPSIWRTYSVVHYLSNKHQWTSIRQIDLELQLVLWKQLRLLLQKKGKKKWTKTQIYSLTSSSLSEGVHLTFSFLKYLPFAAKHVSILLTHSFNGGFKLFLQNEPKDCLGFRNHLGRCTKLILTNF